MTSSQTMMTAGEAARTLASRLRAAGLDTPELDARLLLCAAAGITHEQLLLEPRRALAALEAAMLEDFTSRRLAREPVSRILGHREFRGREFALSRATLDPRPDSETLIDAAIEIHRHACAPKTILDLGTGSGCLLLSLLGEFPGATGLGIDICEQALAAARGNAERLGFAERARFQTGDWLEGLEGTFDLVVSNPPYIPAGEIAELAPEVARHDPRTALDGGPDGLDAYRRIASGLGAVLARDGVVLLEIGAMQEAAVLEIAQAAGLRPGRAGLRHWRDLGGHVRCVALAR